MSDRDSGKGDAGGAHLHRLVLFSDAVFAIAITLLAIEIHPPHAWNGIGDLFAKMGVKLWAYAISFAVVGIYWMSHRRIFERLRAANGVLDVLNFLVLALVALLPLGTELLWEQHGGQALPIYVGLVAAIGVAIALLWAYAAFIGGLAEPTPKAEALYVMLRVALLPGFMCGLSFFSLVYPWGWAVMAAILLGLRWLNGWVARLSRAEAAA